MASIGFVDHHLGSYLISCFRLPVSIHRIRKKQLHLSTSISGTPWRFTSSKYRHIKCASTRKNTHQGLFSEDGFNQEPFWLSFTKDVVWSLRSLAGFLADQPSQLKYIEWPTFQSTLKTATLTLVLVVVLIVALTSIDSLLCYILALLLRKTA